MSIDYTERIPNNVNLAEDRRLQRALESWQPAFLNWWGEMGPTLPTHDVYLRTAVAVGREGWANFGAYPMASGLSRLATRCYAEPGRLAKLEQETGRPIEATEALELGLVTFAPDDLDWDDEIRIALEERASLSPDALTGMEANLRFPGPETMETKIFARLTAWQNWIFTRPNAAGPDGALRRYGTGQRAVFDKKRA